MAVDGKISLALGGAKKSRPPAPTNGVKRSHSALRDGDEEEVVDGEAQTVSHFDRAAGGAIDQANRPTKALPLVIQPQSNRDWRESSQRNKRQKVPEALRRNDKMRDVGKRERRGEEKPNFGLIVKQNGEGDVSKEEPMDVDRAELAQQVPPEPDSEVSVTQKTDEELAMDALLGRATKSDLVLPAMTEEEAFERDFRSAPDMATLDDYARVPVEQFGAALLRGMGWKEGEGIGSQRGKKLEKTKMPERRPALLGIGAKEEAAVKEEMGAWGKAARRGKEAKVYNPVLLKDKRTGELFTEEELEKKRTRDERERYEMEFEQKEKEKDKDKRRRNGSREKGRWSEKVGEERERKREASDDDYFRRKEEKRRRREREKEESDGEYHWRKEKEKRRRVQERDHRGSDRERSKRHDSDRDQHRDRERDRKHRD